jgi:YcxB-like protein
MLQERFSIEYEMTDELAGKVARAVLADRKHFRRFSQWVGLPLFILTVLLFWPTLLVLRDQLSPAVIVAVVVIIGIGFYLLLSLLVYRYTYWTVLLPFLGQDQRTMRVTFSEENIFMEVGEVSGERKWKDLEGIQVFSNLWLFRVQPGGHFAVPVSALSPQLEELIRRKAKEAGTEFQE